MEHNSKTGWAGLIRISSQLPLEANNRGYFLNSKFKMSLFSGKVLLGDLDDFIAPAQACSTGLFSDNPNNTANTRTLIMEDDLNEEFG